MEEKKRKILLREGDVVEIKYIQSKKEDKKRIHKSGFKLIKILLKMKIY